MIRLLAALALIAIVSQPARSNVGTVLYLPQVLREMPTRVVASQCPVLEGLECIQTDEQP